MQMTLSQKSQVASPLPTTFTHLVLNGPACFPHIFPVIQNIIDLTLDHIHHISKRRKPWKESAWKSGGGGCAEDTDQGPVASQGIQKPKSLGVLRGVIMIYNILNLRLTLSLTKSLLCPEVILMLTAVFEVWCVFLSMMS